jgi:hypothetical protein
VKPQASTQGASGRGGIRFNVCCRAPLASLALAGLTLAGLTLGQLLDLRDRPLVQTFVELDSEVLLRDRDGLDGLTAQLRPAETQHERAGIAVADGLGDVLAQGCHAPCGRRIVSDEEIDLARRIAIKLVGDLGDGEASARNNR